MAGSRFLSPGMPAKSPVLARLMIRPRKILHMAIATQMTTQSRVHVREPLPQPAGDCVTCLLGEGPAGPRGGHQCLRALK